MSSEAARTYEEVQTWPAFVNVEKAAGVLCMSRSSAYEALKAGEFPVKTVKVGSRMKVVTSSLLALMAP